MRTEHRLQATGIALLALAIPLLVAAISLTGAINPQELARIQLPFDALNALAAGLGWARLIATGLLAIPVIAAKA